MSNPKPHEPGDVLRCSFCNKSQRDVKKLIAGPTVYICDECIGICVDILAEDGISTEELYSGPLPDQLVLAADKVTPGHHDAKRILAAALTQHAIRVHENETQRAISAVFVCGATGAGKSQLVRGMTQALGLPLGAIDVPLLFADSPFKPKLEFAGFDQKAGVIVLNQIEAVAMRGSKAEECRRVQQALISIIDGAWLQLTAESTRTTHKSTAFDTGRALFIALGSFPEMNSDECIGPEALVRHGYLPELIARFGSFVTLQPLNEQEMTELLIRDDGLVAECTKRFAKYDVRVAFDPPALTEIVRLGARRKAGVRGLKALMDRLGIALACEQTTAGHELHVDAAFVTRNLS